MLEASGDFGELQFMKGEFSGISLMLATPDLLISVAEDAREVLLAERKIEEQENATDGS